MSGRPAWVVHPSGRMYVAFSAICTHAGCTVGAARLHRLCGPAQPVEHEQAPTGDDGANEIGSAAIWRVAKM